MYSAVEKPSLDHSRLRRLRDPVVDAVRVADPVPPVALPLPHHREAPHLRRAPAVLAFDVGRRVALAGRRRARLGQGPAGRPAGARRPGRVRDLLLDPLERPGRHDPVCLDPGRSLELPDRLARGCVERRGLLHGDKRLEGGNVGTAIAQPKCARPELDRGHGRDRRLGRRGHHGLGRGTTGTGAGTAAAGAGGRPPQAQRPGQEPQPRPRALGKPRPSLPTRGSAGAR